MNWCAHRSGNVLHSSAPEVHSSFSLYDHNLSTVASHFRVDPHTLLWFWLESLLAQPFTELFSGSLWGLLLWRVHGWGTSSWGPGI